MFISRTSINVNMTRNSEIFAHQGFVATTNVFTPQQIERMRADIQQAVHSRQSGLSPIEDRHIGTTTEAYTQQFTQCLNLWEDHASIEAIVRNPALTTIAADLLGTHRVRVFQDQALFKGPHGSPTYTHQDLAYWPMASSQCLTAWIPLSPTGSTLQRGAMGYLAGSHQSGNCLFADIAHIEDEGELKANEMAFLNHPDWSHKSMTYVEASVGTVIWHHGLTVHRALPNLTDDTREVFTVVYFADGILRGSMRQDVENVPHFVTDGLSSDEVVRPGEPLASARMPLVYTSAERTSKL